MAAIRIAQAAGGVIVFGEEESGKGAVGSVVAEELVDGAKEALGLVEGDGALAAQIGLKIGHQGSGGGTLPGDGADYETEPAAGANQETAIIPTNFCDLERQSRRVR